MSFSHNYSKGPFTYLICEGVDLGEGRRGWGLGRTLPLTPCRPKGFHFILL